MAPSDPWAAAKVDEALGACSDITAAVLAAKREKDTEQRLAQCKALIAPDGRLTTRLGGLDRSLRAPVGPYYASSKTVAVADLVIWWLAGWFRKSPVDPIPSVYTAQFGALEELYGRVDALPKVAEWKRLHAKHYDGA
eukprot:TRINITY_DN3065_c0_g3_i1.p3 TRINITY_DN3065_c0_g3~~TRINITY_DN3065_c0_g3_i1.p3  ORF type:complete len:138 (+),score=44.48 TRINITY_DN3065_c0_g3_i1:386-799(+)